MGYTTEFQGSFKLNKPLDAETLAYLNKFNQTRRMKRNLDPKYGVEGEFYVDGEGWAGQDRDASIVEYNRPPSTQPSLWCQWRPSEDGTAIEWDEGEKCYNYIEWIEYIIKNFLAPKDYILNGQVDWYGEERDDVGTINVIDNEVVVMRGKQVSKDAWIEHPDFPVKLWQLEVANNDTRLGYVDWVSHKNDDC